MKMNGAAAVEKEKGPIQGYMIFLFLVASLVQIILCPLWFRYHLSVWRNGFLVT